MGIHPYIGTNVSPMQVQELDYRGIVHQGETLFAIFDGILYDDKGKHIGGFSVSDFVVLTDQRVITWARGLFSDTVDGFPWKDVDVVEAKTWDPLHGSVSIAFRINRTAPSRQLRVAVKEPRTAIRTEETERIFINKFDYIPAADVPVLEEMIAWIGDQVVDGITGESLLRAFADAFTFPANEPVALPQPSESSSYAPEPKPPKRKWWSFGRKDYDEVPDELADNPGRLIAAYEMHRGGDTSTPNYKSMQSSAPSTPVTRGGSSGPLSQSTTSVTSVIDRVGLYDFSRGVRLLLDAPKQFGEPINKIVNDTAEMIGDLQDPEMRKRAAFGLQFAANSQQSGLLKLVAPVFQAVLGAGDSDSDSDSERDGEGNKGGKGGRKRKIKSSRRRIQVAAQTNAPVRSTRSSSRNVRVAPVAELAHDMDAEIEEEETYIPAPAVQSRSKSRRQVLVRKPKPSDTAHETIDDNDASDDDGQNEEPIPMHASVEQEEV